MQEENQWKNLSLKHLLYVVQYKASYKILKLSYFAFMIIKIATTSLPHEGKIPHFS